MLNFFFVSPVIHAVAPEVIARNDTGIPHRIFLREELRLGCGYMGVPGPTIRFFQNDSMLLMDGMNGVIIIGGAPSDNEITLVISSVGQMSGGTYTCRANNAVGMDEVVYSVTILGNLTSILVSVSVHGFWPGRLCVMYVWLIHVCTCM